MAVTRIHFKGFTARRYYTILTYHVRTSIFNPYKGYCIYGCKGDEAIKKETGSWFCINNYGLK